MRRWRRDDHTAATTTTKWYAGKHLHSHRYWDLGRANAYHYTDANRSVTYFCNWGHFFRTSWLYLAKFPSARAAG